MNARLILTTSCLLTVLLFPISASSADWEPLPSLPEPNGGFVCGTSRGKIIVAGGTNWQDGQKRWLNPVHVYDPQRQQWTTPWTLSEPVAYAVGGIAKAPADSAGAFVFAAGSNGTGAFNQTVWITGNAISIKPAPVMPKPAVLAAGGVIDGKLMVVGGTDDATNLAGLNRDAFAIDLMSKKGEKLPAYPGRAFGTAASAALGDRLFVFGGANWDTGKEMVSNSAEAHAFSMTTKTWKPLKHLPFAVRGVTAATVSAELIYVAGGYKNDEEGFTDEAFLYNTANDQYTPATPLPYKAMVGLANCDGYLYCLGGEDKKQHRSDACFRIRISDLLKP